MEKRQTDHKMKRLTDILSAPIRRNTRFYVAVLVLFSISVFFVEYSRCSRKWAALEMFGDVYCLCLCLLAVPRRLRRGVKYVLFGFLFVVGVADMVSYLTMGAALVPSVVQTWLQTSRREATEALALHLTPALLLSPLLLLLLLPAAVALDRKRRLTVPPIALPLLLVLTLVSVVSGLGNKRYLWQVYTQTAESDIKSWTDYGSMTHEYLPAYRLLAAVSDVRRFAGVKAELLDNVTHTAVDSCSYDSPLIVLVIGESYNRHHASLYGYDKTTTPRQDKRHREQPDNFFRFDDVIASYNLTFKSFQNMLTFYDNDAARPWYRQPVLPAVFRRAGYEVDFFSNQYVPERGGAFSDYVEDVFMNNADLNGFMFDHRNTESHRYDLQLLNDYHALADTVATDKPRLVIFHFLGLHADYKLRRPDDFSVFHAADYDRPDLNDSQRQLLADYDNAVHYNDFVVDSIVSTFEAREAVVVYVPDHGELVFDDGSSDFGRSFQHAEAAVKAQFDIPFWIFCTDAYRGAHPGLCRQMATATARPFMTDDLPHLLVALAGIHVPYYNPRRNLVDPSFDVHRKRLIWGDTDYDNP